MPVPAELITKTFNELTKAELYEILHYFYMEEGVVSAYLSLYDEKS